MTVPYIRLVRSTVDTPMNGMSEMNLALGVKTTVRSEYISIGLYAILLDEGSRMSFRHVYLYPPQWFLTWGVFDTWRVEVLIAR